MKKRILLIEDDLKTAQSTREILGDKYEISEVNSLGEALKAVSSGETDLIVYDLDMAGGEGLEGYKKIKRAIPRAKVIIISSLNDIPLAVSASKIGVKDFLRKPLEAERVMESIARNISSERRPSLNLNGIEGVEWLKGGGDKLKGMFVELEGILGRDDDAVLFGEIGVDKGSLAKVIHSFGSLKTRRFVLLDLASFGKEFTEAHFWAMIQELMQDRSGEVDDDELCGTIFLSGIETLSEHFVLSIFEFLKKRRAASNLEKIDKAIRIVIAIEDPVKLAQLEAAERLKDFLKLIIPPLRERREDIPLLIDAYLKTISGKVNKRIDSISTEALKFLAIYDWPGNYREFEIVLYLAAQNAGSGAILAKDLPLNFDVLAEEYLSESLSGAPGALPAFRMGFERKIYELVLIECNGDAERAASFLDIPKTAFKERAANIGLITRAA